MSTNSWQPITCDGHTDAGCGDPAVAVVGNTILGPAVTSAYCALHEADLGEPGPGDFRIDLTERRACVDTVISGGVRYVYDRSHCHGAGTVVGYDVVRSLPRPGAVVGYVPSPYRYLEALEWAKGLRDLDSGTYGNLTERYACGCSWAATVLDEDHSRVGDELAVAP